MIIRCPSCSTRFDHPSLLLDREGSVVRCHACGHGWLEGKVVEIAAEDGQALTADLLHTPDNEIQHLVSASRQAQKVFLLHRRQWRIKMAAWLALCLFATSPAAVAVAFPEQVVAMMPATVGFYSWLGHEVNIYGLEIKGLEMQHLLIAGQQVIAIKGELVNVSGKTRKIPWLRFGLKSEGNREVYHWQLDTESRPLKPGEVSKFVTRVASPPERAKTVEIRFARVEEIGSNTLP